MANWFLYKCPQDPLVAASYTSVSGAPACEDGPCLCAVYADNSSGFPVLTAALKDEMVTALVSLNGTTNVHMKCAPGGGCDSAPCCC